MAATVNSGIVESQCQVTIVDRRQLSVQKSRSRPAKPASAEEISVAIYHDDLRGIIGSEPDVHFSILLSSLETSKNPFFYGSCVYLDGPDELYTTSSLLESTSTSQLPVILISKVKLSRDASAKIIAAEWLKLRPPPNMPMPAGGADFKRGVLFCAQGNATAGTGGIFHMNIGQPPTPVVTNYFGRDFDSVQNVAVAKDGSMWFTDWPAGFEQEFRPRPQLPPHVYHFQPDSCELRAVSADFSRPFGIALSPDERRLYLTTADDHLGESGKTSPGAAAVYVFDIIGAETNPVLANKRLFSYPISGVPMGIRCDEKGHVYVGCSGGLEIWSPAGLLLGVFEVPGGVTSFTFGRSHEFFLCSGKRLWMMRLGV
ncbi:D-lactonohydrolase-like protein-like protein [Thozetella sp. PMI_491]|nr:D-lactonohydrolase-like protein-like protein [Thozetella sp. PMI_491]